MANEGMQQDWAEGADSWVRNEAMFDALFAPLTRAVLEGASIGPGQRLLDVGCGSGTLLAAAVAAGADPVGVDISPGMVEAARLRVPDATVLIADAQTTDLLAEAPGRPFDRVVSRFGVMFFADPEAAFANLAAASGPGARMCFVCWRSQDDNPMFSLGTDVLTARLDPPLPASEPGAPGPSALADPDRVRRLLSAAGWAGVEVEPLDVTLDFGYAGTDGVEERLESILATSTGRTARARLEPELGPDGWASLLEEVRDRVRGSVTGEALRIPAATWRVTAGRGRSA